MLARCLRRDLEEGSLLSVRVDSWVSLVGQVAIVTTVVGASRSQARCVGVGVVCSVSTSGGRVASGRGVSGGGRVLVEDILNLVDNSRHIE